MNSRKKKVIGVVYFTILILASATCRKEQHHVSDEANINWLKNAKYDPEILKNLKQFDSLNHFLEVNADSIFGVNHHRVNTLPLSHTAPKTPEKPLQLVSYAFDKQKMEIKGGLVPSSLKAQLINLLKKIENKNFQSVALFNTGAAEMYFKSSKSQNRVVTPLLIYHTGKPVSYNYKGKYLYKDTLVEKDCRYLISLIAK